MLQRPLKALLLITFAFGLNSCGSSDDYQSKIKENRMEKRKHFKYADASPLTNEQKKDFQKLNYFKIDTQYKVKAHVERLSNPDTLRMAYKNGKSQAYIRFARLQFKLKGKSTKLVAYRNVDDKKRSSQNPLFIPFYDATNGKSTYGGGRYLDIKMDQLGNSVTLDFNKAYNPYCAYNDGYACPIPPKENRLEMAVMAGEKKFKAPTQANGSFF